tara:strand:- start:29 stop:205 length:177 start_codon:yes stop_codon:yes gene_type:complete
MPVVVEVVHIRVVLQDRVELVVEVLVQQVLVQLVQLIPVVEEVDLKDLVMQVVQVVQE